MVAYCCAYGCRAKSSRGSSISFHVFPKDPELKKKWVNAISRKNFTPSKYSVICSKHFEENDFLIPVGKRKLNQDAVPSIFDFPQLLIKKVVPRRNKRCIVSQEQNTIKTELPSIPSTANVHPESGNMEQLQVKCLICDREFSQRINLYIHLRNIHKVQTLEPKLSQPTFECENCNKMFLYNSSLLRHTKIFHSLDKEGNKRIRLICPQDGCCERFLNYVNLRQHLLERHDVYVEFEELTFHSAADFEKWKNQIQDETQSFFTLVGGMKRLSRGRSKKTYNCHRSFIYKSKGKNFRASTAASNKIGRICPARIEVIFQNDKQTTISVKFWKTHCGHTEGIGRVISKELSGGRIECGVCKMIFFMRHHFETHICHGKAKKPKRIPCPDCQKTFSSRYNMIRHSHFHSNKRLNNANVNGSLTEKTVELVVNVKEEETFTAVNEHCVKYEEKSEELSDTIVPKEEPMEEDFEIGENSLQDFDYRTSEVDQNSNTAPTVKVESIKL